MNTKRKYYITWRRFFIRLLGSKCARCPSKTNLEIDHIIPHKNNKMSGAGRNNRLRDWKEQYFEGNLQLLCKKCNIEKAKTDIYK